LTLFILIGFGLLGRYNMIQVQLIVETHRSHVLVGLGVEEIDVSGGLVKVQHITINTHCVA
jgi:hypothetical protein